MSSWFQSLISLIIDHPVIFRLYEGKFVVFYYGVWMGSAYCVALWTALFHLAINDNDNNNDNNNDMTMIQGYLDVMCFYMFPCALLGARLLSWIEEDKCDPKQIFRAGFWWHGGLVGTLVGSLFGCYVMQNLPLMPLLDGFALATPAFETFNRMGCLSYGCCWGRALEEENKKRKAAMDYAIQYKNPFSSIHRKQDPTCNQHRYPVQLYAVLLSILQFGIMLPISLRLVDSYSSSSSGFLFLLSMSLSSVVRLLCEQYRGDFRGSGASSTGFFALLQGLVAVAYLAITTSVWSNTNTAEDTIAPDTGMTEDVWGVINNLATGIIWDNQLRFEVIFFASLYAYGTAWIDGQ